VHQKEKDLMGSPRQVEIWKTQIYNLSLERIRKPWTNFFVLFLFACLGVHNVLDFWKRQKNFMDFKLQKYSWMILFSSWQKLYCIQLKFFRQNYIHINNIKRSRMSDRFDLLCTMGMWRNSLTYFYLFILKLSLNMAQILNYDQNIEWMRNS